MIEGAARGARPSSLLGTADRLGADRGAGRAPAGGRLAHVRPQRCSGCCCSRSTRLDFVVIVDRDDRRADRSDRGLGDRHRAGDPAVHPRPGAVVGDRQQARPARAPTRSAGACSPRSACCSARRPGHGRRSCRATCSSAPPTSCSPSSSRTSARCAICCSTCAGCSRWTSPPRTCSSRCSERLRRTRRRAAASAACPRACRRRSDIAGYLAQLGLVGEQGGVRMFRYPRRRDPSGWRTQFSRRRLAAPRHVDAAGAGSRSNCSAGCRPTRSPSRRRRHDASVVRGRRAHFPPRARRPTRCSWCAAGGRALLPLAAEQAPPRRDLRGRRLLRRDGVPGSTDALGRRRGGNRDGSVYAVTQPVRHLAEQRSRCCAARFSNGWRSRSPAASERLTPNCVCWNGAERFLRRGNSRWVPPLWVPCAHFPPSGCTGTQSSGGGWSSKPLARSRNSAAVGSASAIC